MFDGLVRTARLEGRSLLQVSSGVGLAFLSSARNVTRTHLVAPYGEDWQPLRNEGFGAYAARIAGPYRTAINHFDTRRPTWTERIARRLGRWRERARRDRG